MAISAELSDLGNADPVTSVTVADCGTIELWFQVDD